MVFSQRLGHFFRYAVKGPVFLQNERGEVLFYQRDVGPTWQAGGSLKVADHSLTVEVNKRKRQTYKIFDHVTVTIQMIQSDAHANRLEFLLLRNRGHKNECTEEERLEKGEVNFLNEIKKDMERQSKVELDAGNDEEMLDDSLSNIAGKKKAGMFDFFQQMKISAISASSE